MKNLKDQLAGIAALIAAIIAIGGGFSRNMGTRAY